MIRPAILLLVFAASPSFAQPLDVQDALGAREVAMGGAFRVLGTGAAAVEGNPAALSLYKAYQADGTFGWDAARKDGYGAVYVRDSVTTPLAAGLSYHYFSLGRGAQRHGLHQAVLSFGIPLTDTLAIGVGTRWLIQSGPPQINAASLDTGIAFLPFPSLTLGFSGHNLIDTRHAELERFFALGVGWTLGPLRLATDIRSDLGRGSLQPIYDVGGELFVGSSFTLRAGTELDTRRGQHFLSGGLGFVVDNGGIDFAYRHSLDGDGRLLVVTLRVQL